MCNRKGIKMFTAINFGLVRELQAILTLYIATVLSGFSMGFSAISIPGIKEEMSLNNTQSSSVIPSIKASEEELSWFASSVNIGEVFGCLLGGYCGGRFGPNA